MERIMNKCAGCNSFHYEDEMETVTIKLIKHPQCAINGLFDRLDLPKIEPFVVPRDDLELIKSVNKEHGF